jgi:hypothetical protein
MWRARLNSGAEEKSGQKEGLAPPCGVGGSLQRSMGRHRGLERLRPRGDILSEYLFGSWPLAAPHFSAPGPGRDPAAAELAAGIPARVETCDPSNREYTTSSRPSAFLAATMVDSPGLRNSAQIRRVQPDGAVLFCGTNLCVRVAVLKPGVVLATTRGEVVDDEDLRAEAALLVEFDRELERAGTFTIFADLRESARMPAASRERIAQWTRRHQARLLPSHMLVRSQLIEMALSVITMLVGGGLFKVHTNSQTFLSLIKKIAPKLTELPRAPSP